MLLSLSSYAKTVPDNHTRTGFDTGDLGEPGYSITPEALNRAYRQENEYYDWRTYEQIQNPQVEHPEYRSKGEAFALAKHWEEVLAELEPLPR